MVITAEVHNMQKSTIMGQVWIRSAAVSGKIFLEFESDEPGDDEPGDDEPGDDEPGDGGPDDDEPGNSGEPAWFTSGTDDELSVADSFMPLLSGQYEGYCNDERAAFQIQTVKGLAANGEETRGLHGYAIMGRLAY